MESHEAMDHVTIPENAVNIDKTMKSLTKGVESVQKPDTTATKNKQSCYRCKICPYLTLRKPYLVKHMQQKHGFSTIKVSENSSYSDTFENNDCVQLEDTLSYDGTEYSCKVCSFRTTHLNLFNLHQEVHKEVEKDIYQCTQCKFNTEVVEALQEHELTHKKTVLFTCPKCDYASRLKCNLKAHLKIHENQSKSVKFHCEICNNFESSYYSAFVRHIRNKHDANEVFKCITCPYIAGSKEHLKNHEKNHESNEDATLFRCEQCDFVTYNEHTIKRHVHRHIERRKEGDEVIVKEIAGETEIVWFCCNMCEFRSKEQRYVILHKKVHARIDEFNKKAAMMIQSKSEEAKNILKDS